MPRRGSIPAAQGVCCWRPFDAAHLHLQIRLYGQGQRDLVDGERNAGVLHGDGDVEDSKLQRGAEKLTAGVDRQAIRQTHGTPNVGGDAVGGSEEKVSACRLLDRLAHENARWRGRERGGGDLNRNGFRNGRAEIRELVRWDDKLLRAWTTFDGEYVQSHCAEERACVGEARLCDEQLEFAGQRVTYQCAGNHFPRLRCCGAREPL